MSTQDVTESPRRCVSVAAATFAGACENVLFINRRDNGHWEPPSGVFEQGETTECSIRRELREQASAEMDAGPPSVLYKNINESIVALVFRGSTTTQWDPATKHASEIAWLAPARDPHIPADACAARILDESKEAITHTWVRAHDGEKLLPQILSSPGGPPTSVSRIQ